MRHVLVAMLILTVSIVQANDWLTLPSTYSHDAYGVRVSQYAPIEAPTVAAMPKFRTSGYTHTRSSLNYGQSADNYHRVEEWGNPVRPYGEWRFPYRPYSTPYPNWGPPFAGFNLGFPFAGPYGPFGGNGPHGDRYPHDRSPVPGGGVPGGGVPGGGVPGGGVPGGGVPGGGGWNPGDFRNWDGWSRDPRWFRDPGYPASPFNPYPAGGGSPYPVAPYYDGFFPNYPQ